jgi:hypothetical protein
MAPTTAPQNEPARKLEDVKRAKARFQVMALTVELQAFYLKHSRYPESLEELTAVVDGMKPLIEASDLIDPWNARYQYDPAGPKHKGEQPDVWTTASDGSVIGNWEQKK